jgi:hypothetical protein
VKSFNYVCRVADEERMRQLCAQLLRAENPEVIDAVVNELREALDTHMRGAAKEVPRSLTPQRSFDT